MILNLLFIFGCQETKIIQEDIKYESEITGNVVYENQETPEQDPPEIENSVPDQDLIETTPVQEPPNSIIQKIEMISQEKCFNDRIELVLTNPTDQTLTLVKDIVVHLNGLIIVDPACVKSILKPKESIYCSDISGHLPIREEKENTIQISIESQKITKIIDCRVQ